MNDLNMQRSLSHESNLRSRINQLSTPPSPSYHPQNSQSTPQQMPKYLTANSITSKSTNTSSNNLNKNNKLYRNSDERIHENIEYYVNNENNNENYISTNSVYNYSKNSIENMRRLSTEGSEYSSKCPSGKSSCILAP